MFTDNGGSRSGSSIVMRSISAFKQRSADAIRNLGDALHLSSDMSDMAVLSTALAEVVAEESRRNPNPRLAEAVRERYCELSASRPPSTRPRKQKQELPALVPLVPTGRTEYDGNFHINPFAPPDPAEIINVYGTAQLGRALQDYMLDSLKQTAVMIESEHPGTKPSNRGRKDAVIAYIVKYAGE